MELLQNRGGAKRGIYCALKIYAEYSETDFTRAEFDSDKLSDKFVRDF